MYLFFKANHRIRFYCCCFFLIDINAILHKNQNKPNLIEELAARGKTKCGGWVEGMNKLSQLQAIEIDC